MLQKYAGISVHFVRRNENVLRAFGQLGLKF